MNRQLNRIEKIFINKSIARGGTILYQAEDAIEFIKKCAEKKMGILGIDGFFITPNTTQPSMENSLNYSSEDWLLNPKGNIYNYSIDFITQRKHMYFAITCDD